ncbi:hypothetical protein NUU61_002958 [Penicillium alfredii]|uniref:Uncharacterized protein n=1 Tax=Penicillium alfredii TaxID=1506179 RepID=A0A9W9FSG6_9EURO|nr:uncharacterized protein NUU61_002958 [Penicillium alfredii]KAJ5105611.1 hypothetical protein NUU61_002958 [Penicillium alfredii]
MTWRTSVPRVVHIWKVSFFYRRRRQPARREGGVVESLDASLCVVDVVPNRHEVIIRRSLPAPRRAVWALALVSLFPFPSGIAGALPFFGGIVPESQGTIVTVSQPL